MLPMSNAYKQSMNSPLRNQSYCVVTVGAINQSAQKGCHVSLDGLQYSYLSNLEKPFDNYDVEFPYATWEENRVKADGKMIFPPRQDSDAPLFNNGIITRDLINPIKVQFDNTYDIRGLTIDWSDNYPVDFMVSNENTILTITDNDKRYWITEKIFDGTNSLLITPIKMSGGQNRLRINKMSMGVGISFENTKIINADMQQHISPITEELPTVDFKLKVENFDRAFDVENKESAINYLEVGQDVTVKYGYEVTKGKITWIDGCVTKLTEWKADDKSMEFNASDLVSLLDGTYYKGLYRENGISLYDLAVDVFTDAGFDERQYKIDSYLHDVIVKNPLPPTTHAECLQIIANAGRCKLWVDRTGIITLTNSFESVKTPDKMIVESNDAESYSTLDAVVNGSVKYEYATWSQNQLYADGSAYFVSMDNTFLNSSFVSKQVSDADGNFAVNPKVKIILEASTKFYGLSVNFMSNPPKKIIFHAYRDGELVESYPVERDYGLSNIIQHEFERFDELELEFAIGRPNSRVFLESVVFGDITDYNMDYDVMLASPVGRQDQKIKVLNVIRNQYFKDGEEQSIFSQTIDFTAYDDYSFYFSEPTYDASAWVKDTEIEIPIIDSSSYFVKLDTRNLTGEVEIEVFGRTYTVIEAVKTNNLNPTGETVEWNNPLVESDEHATQISEWIGNYLLNNIEYEISYRGEPRIDIGDIVFLENKYIDKLQILIYEHKLSFNGALKGSVSARRAMNNV